MFDPFQTASILQQQENKKNNKLFKIYISSLVGMIVAVAGIYFVDVLFNLINKKKINELFKVSSSWQLYYASVIAGGINGILVVLLPPKLYRFAAVIVITILYEVLSGLSNGTTLDNSSLVKVIVRDVFLIFFIIDLYKKLFKDYNKKNKEDDKIVLDDILNVSLLSSIVLNVGIVTTKTGLNNILGI